MAELVKNAQSINEAVALVHGVDAACGPASAYELAGAVGGFKLTDTGLQNLVSRGISAGTLTTGGQNVDHVLWDMEQYGVGGNIWNASSQAELASTLDSNLAADKPTVMGLSEGHFLTDEPAALHGHFVTVVGKNTDGSYVTADPNTVAASSGGFTANSAAQLFAAQGLGNITPNKSAGGSFVTSDISGASISGLDSSISGLSGGTSGITFPSLINVSLDFSSWKNPLVRLGFGIIGGIIIIISANNLLGALGIPNIQSGVKAALNYAEQKEKEAIDVAKVAAIAA